jgi:hypothetical protein
MGVVVCMGIGDGAACRAMTWGRWDGLDVTRFYVDRALATREDEPRWRQAVLAVSDPIFASVLLLTSCLLLVVAADAGVIPG